MAEITGAALATFRERGYVVITGVLSERQLAAGLRTAAAMLTAEPPAAGHTGPYFLWPRFGPVPGADGCGHDHGLLRFYRQSGIGELAAALLRPDLPPDEPDFAQLATTSRRGRTGPAARTWTASHRRHRAARRARSRCWQGPG